MLFAFTVIYFTYPETKGLTLEEVEIVFGTGAGQRVKEALGQASPVDPRTPCVHLCSYRIRLRADDHGRIHYKVNKEEVDDMEGQEDKTAYSRQS